MDFKDHRLPPSLAAELKEARTREEIAAHSKAQQKAFAIAEWDLSLRGKIACKENKRRRAEINQEIEAVCFTLLSNTHCAIGRPLKKI